MLLILLSKPKYLSKTKFINYGYKIKNFIETLKYWSFKKENFQAIQKNNYIFVYNYRLLSYDTFLPIKLLNTSLPKRLSSLLLRNNIIYSCFNLTNIRQLQRSFKSFTTSCSCFNLTNIRQLQRKRKGFIKVTCCFNLTNIRQLQLCFAKT